MELGGRTREKKGVLREAKRKKGKKEGRISPFAV